MAKKKSKAARKRRERAIATKREEVENGRPETRKAEVKAPKAAKKAASSGGTTSVSPKGIFESVATFLREVKVELKKVNWPTRKETLASTIMVVVITTICMLYLALVDLGLSSLIKMVLGRT